MAEHLQLQGWQVLERRWLGAGAELDLVVRRGGQLRFVEVKLRQADDPVGLEAVDGRKVRRLNRAGEAYLARYDGPLDEVCLMVALVQPGPDGLHIELFDDPV